MTEKSKPVKRRRKRQKNHYFTKVHEEAIINYVATNDIKVRTQLYVDYIQPAFNEMVDKIVYTYRFTSLPNIDALRDECKVWLTTILDKYDPARGSKAFSYFSVITKNWFIHKVKKNSLTNKREVNYDTLPKHLEIAHLSTTNAYEKQREHDEFWEGFRKEMESWDSGSMKQNEEKVYEAIRILFSRADDIEIFNKKAVYLYMREITGLNTKQVVNNLKKMKQRYYTFKAKWDKGDI